MSDSTDTPQPSAAPAWLAPVARGLVVLGGGLLSLGAGMAWRPAGFMVAGALLLVVGLGALR